VRLEFFPYPFLIGLGILSLILAVLRHRKYSFSYLLCFGVFWVYLMLVVSATLFPIPIVNGEAASWQSTKYIFARINLIPFDYSRYYILNRRYIFFREIAANILLTVPFGFGISFITWFRARHILWLAPAVGFGIETMQLALCLALGLYYRGVDISDALVNALGVYLGYSAFVVFSLVYTALTKHFQIEQKGLLAYVFTITGRIQFKKPNWPPFKFK